MKNGVRAEQLPQAIDEGDPIGESREVPGIGFAAEGGAFHQREP
jgi:hypothetical protein